MIIFIEQNYKSYFTNNWIDFSMFRYLFGHHQGNTFRFLTKRSVSDFEVNLELCTSLMQYTINIIPTDVLAIRLDHLSYNTTLFTCASLSKFRHWAEFTGCFKNICIFGIMQNEVHREEEGKQRAEYSWTHSCIRTHHRESYEEKCQTGIEAKLEDHHTTTRRDDDNDDRLTDRRHGYRLFTSHQQERR